MIPERMGESLHRLWSEDSVFPPAPSSGPLASSQHCCLVSLLEISLHPSPSLSPSGCGEDSLLQAIKEFQEITGTPGITKQESLRESPVTLVKHLHPVFPLKTLETKGE